MKSCYSMSNKDYRIAQRRQMYKNGLSRWNTGRLGTELVPRADQLITGSQPAYLSAFFGPPS